MTIGIICAIPEETKSFSNALSVQSKQRHGDALFLKATLSGTPIILVECGIGKVNAAFAATILCDYYSCQTIIFSGIAGGLDPALHIGDIVIADRLFQIDYGRYQSGKIIPYLPGIAPLAEPKGETGYLLSVEMKKKLSPLLLTILPNWENYNPKVQFGTILTGDTFLNDEIQRVNLYNTHAGLAIEMEGAAIAQIAQKYNVDVIIIRALSDLAGDDSHIDFVNFGQYAAEIAAKLVLHAINLIS